MSLYQTTTPTDTAIVTPLPKTIKSISKNSKLTRLFHFKLTSLFHLIATSIKSTVTVTELIPPSRKPIAFFYTKITTLISTIVIIAALSPLIIFTRPSTTDQKLKAITTPTRTHTKNLRQTTIDLAKLMYNLGKLHIARELCFHAIPRNYSIVQRSNLLSGNGAELIAVCIAVCALLESVYDSYADTFHRLLYASNSQRTNPTIPATSDHIHAEYTIPHTLIDTISYTPPDTTSYSPSTQNTKHDTTNSSNSENSRFTYSYSPSDTYTNHIQKNTRYYE